MAAEEHLTIDRTPNKKKDVTKRLSARLTLIIISRRVTSGWHNISFSLVDHEVKVIEEH